MDEALTQMSEEYREFDASDYVKTEDDVRGFLRAAWDEDIGDGAVICAVLRRIARTQSMSALAHDIGLNGGEGLSSQDGNLSLATFLKVTRALGLCLAPIENST